MATKQRKTSTRAPEQGEATGRSAAPRPLDDTDRAIIAALVDDARTSVRTLAERLHISRANAYARLDRLLEQGAITGFTARIDPVRVGLGTTAYVSINMEQNTWRTVSGELQRLPFVDSVALLASEFDALVLVHAPDNTTLRTLVLDRIQAIKGVTATRTWLAFEEIRGPGPDWAALPTGK